MELGADDRITEVPISYNWQGALTAKHSREYDPRADHEFPLRDVINPVGRVDARYADPSTGGVAPNVRVESVRAAMGSRQLINHLSAAGMTISSADLNRSMALLNENIQNEMERLIGNSRGQQRVRQPLIQGVRLSNNDPSLEEHERAALAGQWDLRVVAQSNGSPLQFLGIYAGSVMRSDADVRYMEENETEHSRYALQASSSFRTQTAAYGTAPYGNSTALANVALRPLSETQGIPEYDEARINSMFLEFDVRLTGANGKTYTETLAVLVGLPNLFGPNNPHRRVLVNLRDSFLDQIQNELQPSSSDRARRAERRQRATTPPIKEEQ